MPLTFSSEIEDEVEAAELGAVDLIEVDLGLGFKKFWSTTNVGIEWVVTEFGSAFEPRILTLGNRRWNLGLDDDTLNITIGNADGAISRIAKEFGIDIFEGAIVRHHRLFTSIKEIYKDYWCGTGLPMQWSEGECSWDIAFGTASLKQKFGRKIEFTCPHVFAGGLSADCPYHPEGASIGIPEPKVVATAGVGTTTSTIDGAVGLSAVSVGWIVFNRDENSYYRVTGLVDDTEVSVVFTNFGDNGSNTLNSGDKLFIGPPFTECAKTPEECQERGMYGKHSGNTGGWGTKLRYFGGSAAHSSVRFTGRLPNPEERFGHGSADRFSRTSAGNDSLEGSTIPVIFGRFVLRDVPSIFVAPAGAFQHGYFILCEGEIFDFHVLSINGSFQPDNNSPQELDTLLEQLRNDSFIKWGVWWQNTGVGVNDNRVGTSPDLAKQIRGSVGQRRAVGVSSGNKILDTYGEGTPGSGRGNPYLFSKPQGEGVSSAGTVSARIRIETQQDILDALTADFSVTGLLVPLVPGSPLNELELTALQFTGLDDPPGPSSLSYTVRPNPIQVAYELLKNRRWGAGIPESKIDLPSVVVESNFCEEHIESIESGGSTLIGTVIETSADNPGFATGVWIFTENIFANTRSLVNRPITFNKGTSKSFTAVIDDNEFFEIMFDDSLEGFDSGSPFLANSPTGAAGTLIRIDQAFPSSKVPVNGDTFEMPSGRFITRFKANGIIGNDAPIPDILQDVLDNCNGTFRTNKGKIEFIIRKKLSATEIDTVISDGIFTDRGVKRNILRNDGVSTMKVWREDEKTLGNFFTVDFQDQDRDYKTSRVAVFNDAAQVKAAKLFGNPDGRLKISDGVNLILTTTKDQAARLLALRARELFIQNLFCSFETSLKRGMKALPGDIIAVDSEAIAAHFNVQLLAKDVAVGNSFLFRILEKIETSAYTINFSCQVHVNPIYESFATDFTQFFSPDATQKERGQLPAPTTPLAVAERVVLNSDGTVRSVLTVKVTYPDLAV